ncbi:MAG: adenylate/guanylate cyclase domain-containing protein [Rhodospirillales bacterium]|jgi:adenylate cyclase|nr:adenylate/guanylate cyclase domain-containing protein [Rhodospirillales bacterium]MBT4039107.1 adenylate/guanylate cyclase domain-containing protein [Rhodospirillales bacterium]MBT4625508.1 adenylate/guanylate cyclase domain-containing protein [Rhodospirillales bacterium]MBT5352146.1 adenylate/guanylate cyclase domain-containing protein [Rhodospirillales bacterium]MBT5521915.1 adenylate/guanylate cyclase domain-containing protein [Rhodospirillales bacterium]
MSDHDTATSSSKSLSTFVFGPPPEGNVPERISAAVEQQQNQSEILVGWIQLTLVVTLGTLYALSPKMSAAGAIQAVPVALGLYLLFTISRLVASYRIALPGWILMGSVIIDVTLLMTLIWSFHIQYDQPASFYLKAPTMLYVFIFIALRALRFDPRYILMAGGTAIVGWLALVLYVILSDPSDPMITRNYVEYLTSNSILIGAEVDKLISIAMVTVVLAVAISRGQRMMRRAAMDQVAARDLSRFVPQDVAQHITHAEESIKPGDGESKVATVLFTDIEGYSTLSEGMSPQLLVSTLNEYFGVADEIVQRHGGTISQYQGDAMLITFNTVQADEDHAANAIRTALDLREAFATRMFGEGTLMKTRCGINTGEMTVGAVGSDARLIFTVHGDEVNVAARLEQLNKEHGTYLMVSVQTRDAAGPEFSYRPVCEVVVRGRSTPTDVFTID